MATSILLKFLTFKWNISRTTWRIEVGDGSLFCIFHALSFELNFFFDWRFPLRETTSVEEINKLKEYFVNEYPEIFQVECALEKVYTELERIIKHDKRIREVEEKLLTSISMEPFTNYEGIENVKTISTIQKIVLYQKAIDDMKRRHIYFTANKGKLLEKCFIQGRNIYKKTLKESGLSRQWAHFL